MRWTASPRSRIEARTAQAAHLHVEAGELAVVAEANGALSVVRRLRAGESVDVSALDLCSPRPWLRAGKDGAELVERADAGCARDRDRLLLSFALRNANVDMDADQIELTMDRQRLAPGEKLLLGANEKRVILISRGGGLAVSTNDGVVVDRLRAGEIFVVDASMNVCVCATEETELRVFAGDLPVDNRRLLRALAAKKAERTTQVEDAAPESSSSPLPVPAPPRAPMKKERRKKRIPYVEQIDEADCGPTCLLMIARYFGITIERADLRSIVSSSIAGTTLLSLCRAADKLGLKARALKVSRKNLEAIPLPAILHWEGKHWVVLSRILDRRRVEILDPAASAPRSVTREELFEAWNGYAVLIEDGDAAVAAVGGVADARQSVRWVAKFVRPVVPAMGLAGILALLETALLAVLPLFTQVAVDRILPASAMGLLYALMAGVVLTFVLVSGASVLRSLILALIAARLDSASLDWLAERLLALPMSYFLKRRIGDVERRLGSLHQARDIIVNDGVTTLLALMQLVGAAVILALQHTTLGLLAILLLPLMAVLSNYARIRLRPLYTRLEDVWGAYYSDQIEVLRAIATIKSTSSEYLMRKKMVGRFASVAEHQVRSTLLSSIFDAGVRGITFASTAAFLWIGVRACMNHEMTLGAFVASGSLLAFLTDPVHVIMHSISRFQMLAAIDDRLSDVLTSRPEQPERANLRVPRSLRGDLELRGVTFAYDGGGNEILKDIDVTVRAGERIAIVGRSGSGKTTLASLLGALMMPTGGTIHFDGMDHRTLLHSELRRRIGFVPQNVHLFSGTILENICLGGDELDLTRAISCATAAHAHDFIEQFALGYDTRVGESGIALSGGQAQRLALARALYTDPPILILDEATSALDAESERVIQENLGTISANRTTIIIAHRLSTVRDCDRILVMDRGRIVEEGTHDELVARQGLYRALVSNQIGDTREQEDEAA